jgi:DNA mismatch endonuclease (patch repair protein)
MSDNLTPENRRKTMKAVKGKGTKLEKRLCAILAGMGIGGWKKNVQYIAGKPDVAFPSRKIAIFVDGCFWHGCPQCHRKLPATNQKYWRKIYSEQLNDDGWMVIRIWEHEIISDATRLKSRLKELKNGKITKGKPRNLGEVA